MPLDTNADNVYEVKLVADDGNGLTTLQTVTVTVDPVNDLAPVFTSAAAANVAENTAAVLTISATDGDSPAQTVSFSISGNGADDAKFEITGGNQLVFIAAPDFETPLDANADNVYEVKLVADDGNGLTTLQTVTVTVDPVNDLAPVFTSAAAANVAENTAAVLTISATDGDSPAQTVSFSISGNGADDTKFEITGGNQLVFIAAPDFETPLDANADNVYEVELVADDGGGMTTLQTVLVTITSASTGNDHAPVFTSAVTESVAENTTAVQTISATDADLPAQVITFAISGNGADDTKFQITGGDQLVFIAARDFETPLDANSDNVYEVELVADDGHGLTTLQTVLVTIVQVNEAPFIVNSIPDITADDDRSDDVIDLSAVFGDVDAGDTLTLTVGGNTNPSLVDASITGSALTLDYLLDQSGTAEITILATDSDGLFVEETFTVTVLSSSDQVDNIIGEVENLNASGVLNDNDAKPLISKLNGALSKVFKGNTKAATNQIKAFINQVNAFTNNGKLTAAQGESLIAAAQSAIDSIESGGGSSLVVAASSQSNVADTVTPIIDAHELVIATIGVSLFSADGSIQPGEHSRFLDALATLNTTLGGYGVALVELADSAAIDTEIHVELASTSPCGDVSAGVLGCAAGIGEITVLVGWNWYTGEDATSVVPGQYDFQTIVTHEIGHAIGLDHSGDSESVMYFELSSGTSHRDLTAQDLTLVKQDGEPEALVAQGFAPVDDHEGGRDVLHGDLLNEHSHNLVHVSSVALGSNTLAAMDLRLPGSINALSQRFEDRSQEDERMPPATVDAKTPSMREELVDQVFSLAGTADADDLFDDLDSPLEGNTRLTNDAAGDRSLAFWAHHR